MSKLHHADVAKQAYYLWLDDGMTHGKAEQHWALAEKLLSQAVAPVAPKKTRAKSAKPTPRATRIKQAAAVLHS